MTYTDIMKQTDYESAARTYVMEKYGALVAQTFPILSSILIRGIIAGKPESMVLAEVLAGYSLKPL
ncbi:hypothetical protein [Pseudomonas petrae]|uniref:Uncharacterized protein n=1 Tax=Pseudomonas petrae TaxID=2912190 RepID=A0ABS9I380_9PSED|nr:hypothetical protein [Pseudomonas petrae]MCF7533783.1 hypothetical protein [Pseudomonas petrae]MCF7538330.1 hypothetical protein [Pseudomonas petrae]MCF7542250.1 hypothetical protein [Pseudomonas petrae]MCF7555695.1 hypothetical protein [Pseudomonas petrae]